MTFFINIITKLCGYFYWKLSNAATSVKIAFTDCMFVLRRDRSFIYFFIFYFPLCVVGYCKFASMVRESDN